MCIVCLMRIIAKNKRASFEYDIEKTWDAGIMLDGHEVKSLKMQWCDLRDGIIRPDLTKKCLTLFQVTIPLYKKANLAQLWRHESDRSRILLVNKKELTTIISKTHKTGLSIIPLSVREDKHRRIKVTIGIWKRKKLIQKKQHIKENDQKRSMDRAMKHL